MTFGRFGLASQNQARKNPNRGALAIAPLREWCVPLLPFYSKEDEIMFNQQAPPA